MICCKTNEKLISSHEILSEVDMELRDTISELQDLLQSLARKRQHIHNMRTSVWMQINKLKSD